MRRVLNETAISAGALGVLFLVLVSSDVRVREQVALHLSGRPTAELASAGKQMTDLTGVLFEAARDQSIAHAPLLILVVAAVALLVFLVRT
jgi:hypothetical protein